MFLKSASDRRRIFSESGHCPINVSVALNDGFVTKSSGFLRQEAAVFSAELQGRLISRALRPSRTRSLPPLRGTLVVESLNPSTNPLGFHRLFGNSFHHQATDWSIMPGTGSARRRWSSFSGWKRGPGRWTSRGSRTLSRSQGIRLPSGKTVHGQQPNLISAFFLLLFLYLDSWSSSPSEEKEEHGKYCKDSRKNDQETGQNPGF